MSKRNVYQLCEHSDDDGDEEEVADAAAAARLVAAEADAAAARGTVAYGNAAAELFASDDDDDDGIPAGWQWQIRDVPMRELAVYTDVPAVPVAVPPGCSVRACQYTDVRLRQGATAVGSVPVAVPRDISSQASPSHAGGQLEVAAAVRDVPMRELAVYTDVPAVPVAVPPGCSVRACQYTDVRLREVAAAVGSVPVAEPRGISSQAGRFRDVRLLEVAAAVGSVRVALPVPVPVPVPLPVPVPVLGPCPCLYLHRDYRPISCPCRLVEKTSARSWHAR